MKPFPSIQLFSSLLVLMFTHGLAQAQGPADANPPTSRPESPDVLTPAQAHAVDSAVDRALAWMVRTQKSDGSFPTLKGGQPGVTALCVLALISRGHLPGQGPYGESIDRAVQYVLRSQASDGVIAQERAGNQNQVYFGQTAAYNHAISGLMLAEICGQMRGQTNEQILKALESALTFSLKRVPLTKRNPSDEGGWRYFFVHQSSDSDLSVTSWELMFLRSCKNAGFQIPSKPIDEAVTFVERCYDPNQHFFWYALRGREKVTTRAMTGAGILSLSLAGRHNTPQAMAAGDWVLAHPFNKYMQRSGIHDRFFYGAFYCSQAMYQLGGKYWEQFYPVLCRTLVDNQNADGSWRAEEGSDYIFGNVYSSALAVLALSPRYQLLPIFQR